MEKKWSDLSIEHLGQGNEEEPVIAQIDDALRRVCLLVDNGQYADKGSVDLKIKIKRVDIKDEEGEVCNTELVVEAVVKRTEPARVNTSIDIKCVHGVDPGDGQVLVRAQQIQMFDEPPVIH